MQLTFAERWILINQYKILSQIEPDSDINHEKVIEVLEGGFEGAYTRYVQDIETRTVSAEICREVSQILTMFVALHRSYDALDDNSGIDPYRVHFRGFDVNDENPYYRYTHFLLEIEGRFSELSAEEGMGMNLPRYREMYRRWDTRDDRHTLSREAILQILGG